MYVRGYLQGSENGRVVTIDHKEDCVLHAHAHVAVELSVFAINTECLGDSRAIFRVGVFRNLAFHCTILNIP